LAEVRGLTAGSPELFGERYSGERVPTLTEALAFLRGRARVLIEMKSDSAPPGVEDGIEDRMVAEVRKAGMARDIALLSVDTRALVRARVQAPELAGGHLFYRRPAGEMVEAAREAGCDLVMPEKGMLDDALLRKVRTHGLKLGTWIVDEPAELEALQRYELFGVASNAPGRLL